MFSALSLIPVRADPAARPAPTIPAGVRSSCPRSGGHRVQIPRQSYFRRSLARFLIFLRRRRSTRRAAASAIATSRIRRRPAPFRTGGADHRAAPGAIQRHAERHRLRPVTGVASVTFAIYAEQDGGTRAVDRNTKRPRRRQRPLQCLLGARNRRTASHRELFGTGQSRWLGVTIARSPEMPRVLLASVPYALKAGDADTLGGFPASEYVTAQIARRVERPRHSRQSSRVAAAPRSSRRHATSPRSTQTPRQPPRRASDPQATPTGTGTTNFIPIWTSSPYSASRRSSNRRRFRRHRHQDPPPKRST